MNPENTSDKLEGIIVPMVTPLLSNGELDRKGTERLIRHLTHGGVHGIFILGTTGEASSLKPAIKKELIEITCKETQGQHLILVGITHTALDVSLKIAKTAKENGADAVVAAPPYYFSLDQEDLFKYYIKLADLSPLPLFLYNFPVMTKNTLEPETVHKLSQHPNIIGIKDSSGNGVYFQKLLALKKVKPEFSVLIGPEEMLAQSVLSGCDGGVSGGANIFPNLYVRLFEAAKNRDFEMISKIQPLILEISKNIYGCSPKTSSYLCGVKESLYYLGICEPHIAPPLQSVNAQAKETIIQNLEKIIFKIKTI
ncbi:4-hydroxy-tetrahydrodipicolinate synthase [Aquiflexum balticum DSM 16537]|uniref:4-hydroxy-tetrahydrodipicolinate synthase n=1 Tax=Aquiflexum balticum DSM 16537 TaxID=758820 RepID=A0A1W2GYM5_9BACT|nr:dihydrodipicolinate synthase family protein [Aquiflexum balticum]SMD41753.1 4-hydroxy-tetrahydrodipicolinate synthase [Aquiflexum balticum DSM 16537]